jgi:hypothetical protein
VLEDSGRIGFWLNNKMVLSFKYIDFKSYCRVFDLNCTEIVMKYQAGAGLKIKNDKTEFKMSGKYQRHEFLC